MAFRTSSSRTLATLSDAYDVVVSGGGIVGTLLACNLGKRNRMIHILSTFFALFCCLYTLHCAFWNINTNLRSSSALDPNLKDSSKLLIEAQKETPSVEEICQKMATPDARVYAFSQSSVDALQAVGAWDPAVDAREGCGIYMNMQVFSLTTANKIAT